jgi:hypothetical protein
MFNLLKPQQLNIPYKTQNKIKNKKRSHNELKFKKPAPVNHHRFDSNFCYFFVNKYKIMIHYSFTFMKKKIKKQTT